MTWIKICGTTNLEDALMCAEAGADALGFVFAESPRRIDPKTAAWICDEVRAQRAGVFVNAPIETMLSIAKGLGLNFIQLHGGESDATIGELRSRWEGGFRPFVIKVEHLLPTEPLPPHPAGQRAGRICLSWSIDRNKAPDGIVLDTKSEVAGGSGKTFDWNACRTQVDGARRRMMPLIIAGGLTPQNVADAVRLFRPWGVDVVSGVELAPGKKDPAKVKAFIQAVREADRSQ